jgi:hypothetical protein
MSDVGSQIRRSGNKVSVVGPLPNVLSNVSWLHPSFLLLSLVTLCT